MAKKIVKEMTEEVVTEVCEINEESHAVPEKEKETIKQKIAKGCRNLADKLETPKEKTEKKFSWKKAAVITAGATAVGFGLLKVVSNPTNGNEDDCVEN